MATGTPHDGPLRAHQLPRRLMTASSLAWRRAASRLDAWLAAAPVTPRAPEPISPTGPRPR